MAIIIEESETPRGERIATVTTKRGDDVLINVDRAVETLADLFSDLDNEARSGWTLNAPWYEDAIRRLRSETRQDITAAPAALNGAEQTSYSQRQAEAVQGEQG